MTIQFHTKVSKGGIIRIPRKYKMDEERVKIIIEQDTGNKIEEFDFEVFVSKWGGFFKSDIDPDQARLDHLIEKYK